MHADITPKKNRLSKIIMMTGLPLIILTLIYIAACAAAPETFMPETAAVHRACVKMLEHTLMSLAIITGASALTACCIE